MVDDVLKLSFLVQGSENKVTVKDFEKAKIICLYFSAHWCPPCQAFTPKLADFYKAVNATEKKLEIIFLSWDNQQGQFDEYRNTMPWISLPYKDPIIEKKGEEFNIQGIPSLLVFKDGKLVTNEGRKDVTNSGPVAYEKWLK